MYSAGQIARAAAPVKTRMGMPAHLEAMIASPAKKHTPKQPVVDMAAFEKAVEAEVEKRLLKKVVEFEDRIKFVAASRDIWLPSRPEKLLSIVAGIVGTTKSAIKGPSRVSGLVRVRWMAAWIMNRNCKSVWGHKISLAQIGRILGKDHSSIIHGLKRIENCPDLLKSATELEWQVLTAEAQIYGDHYPLPGRSALDRRESA